MGDSEITERRTWSNDLANLDFHLKFFTAKA